MLIIQGKDLASFGLTGMSQELVSCSCEALAGSLLPETVEVKYITNYKERSGRLLAQCILGQALLTNPNTFSQDCETQ